MPLDPTNENLQWLAGIAITGPFPCEWRGLAHVDGWAAQYTDVVDYYFNDGHDRLRDDLAKFTAISGISMVSAPIVTAAAFESLTPADVPTGIAQLRHTLNQRDPHFFYDFSVTGSPPARIDAVPPSLVASKTVGIGNSYVTFDVHTRCAESLNERPVTASMTFVAEPGSIEERELEEFLKYGRTPDRPVSARNVTVDMPGGLGMSNGDGTILVREAGGSADNSFARRLSILAPDDQVLASVDATLYPPVSNFDGTGHSNGGQDASGVLGVEVLSTIGTENSMVLRLSRGDISGRLPDEIEPALALLDSFCAPNRFRIAPVRGNGSGSTQIIPSTEEVEETSRRLNEFLLDYGRCLITIQRHTTTEIKIPSGGAIDDLNISDVRRAARLLNGETVETRWNHLQFTLNPGARSITEPVHIVFEQAMSLTVGEDELDLGAMRVVLEAARLARVSVDDGVQMATLEAALDNHTAQLVWLGESSIHRDEI